MKSLHWLFIPVAIVALSSCGLFGRKPVAPPALPPSTAGMQQSAVGAGEAIAGAGASASAVEKASDETSAHVQTAKTGVDAMLPPLDAAKKAGGPAADVAHVLLPLQESASASLLAAVKSLGVEQKAVSDLKSGLTLARERVGVLTGQVALSGAETQKLAAELEKAKADLAAERKSRADERQAGLLWWRNAMLAASMLLGLASVAVLLVFKMRDLAGWLAGLAVAAPMVFFVVQGLFKAERFVVPMAVAFFVSLFALLAWKLWRLARTRIRLVQSFEYAKDKDATQPDVKARVAEIQGAAVTAEVAEVKAALGLASRQ